MTAPAPVSEDTTPLDRRSSSGALWLGVSAGLVGLVAVAAAFIIGGEQGPIPPFLQSGARTPMSAIPPPVRAGEGLRLAGSGSNLPLTRALAAAYQVPEVRRPVVHASIGSGGGVRALLDGVIDIALVSRPLKPAERDQGLVATPYARVPVVVAVHASVPAVALSSADLVEIYAGKRTTWSDGSRIAVLQRERGDSSHSAVAKVLPEFDTANELAYRDGRWRVLYHDDALREALAATPGAIGLYGQGSIPTSLPIKGLAIDGIEPTLDTIERGIYPFSKDLAFVTRGAPQGEAARFIAFASSVEGQKIVESAGGAVVGSNPKMSGHDR